MYKRYITITVTFLGGVYFFLMFFVPQSVWNLRQYLPEVSKFFMIMGSIAIGIGIINIFMVYGRRVIMEEKTWAESLALIIAFLITVIVGLWDVFAGESQSPESFHLWNYLVYVANQLYWQVIFNGLFMSIGAAIFSLLAFYITQAAFRAFRVKSTEAALIMASAVLIMLGSLPMPIFENILPVWLGAIRVWLLSGINVGVQRAVLLGSGTAYLIMAVRMWFSLDKSTMLKSRGSGF